MLIKDKSALGLPAGQLFAPLRDALAAHDRVVVTAPPGAGKSTLLPLCVLEALQSQPNSGVLMLEPRRIAARRIAERTADLLGESPGGTVGYRIRFESRIGPNTSLEILTEGILTRLLVDDPTLDGVGAIIFDEFHERSLAADTALALALECQTLLRPDLKIILMSATIDAAGLASRLGAITLSCEGRMYPVQTVWCPECNAEKDPAAAVARIVRRAITEQEGDILAFLPGEAEIKRCCQMLSTGLGTVAVLPLYSHLSPAEQQRAIEASRPGERKVVLATSIAETSLTIEGVKIVVDSLWCRRPVFDARTSMSRLKTVRVSTDMADQRRGRAGRLAPGTCYRLMGEAQYNLLPASSDPEILCSDLADTLLQVAAWGERDIFNLPWVTPPPATSVRSAASLLTMMGAIDSTGAITRKGRSLADLPCHPRIANMLLGADTPARKALSADIAAILEVGDPLSDCEQSDISIRIKALEDRTVRSDQIVRARSRYRSLVHAESASVESNPFEAGALLSAAYPEKVACLRSPGRFALSTGEAAFLPEYDTLSDCDWIVAASVGGQQDSTGRIFLCAPVEPHDLLPLCRERDRVEWSARDGAVICRHEWRLGALLVDSKPIGSVNRDQVMQALCAAAPKEGLSMFDFSEEVQDLQRRIATVARWHPELSLPAVDTARVLESVNDWLPLFGAGATNLQDLRKVNLCEVIWSMLTFEQRTAVEERAPSHICVPTGSRIRVEYRQGADAPVLRVRLQECFGLDRTPMVDKGTRPVLMELLSPGYKCVQITSDLASFWNNAYFEVRAELRRRYPKHFWPDNPLEAEAVRGVKRR